MSDTPNPNPPVPHPLGEAAPQLTPQQFIELQLNTWCGKTLGLSECNLREPHGGKRVRNWMVDTLVQYALVQNLHLEALRRISASLGHPLNGVPEKTALDLAEIVVAKLAELNAPPSEMRLAEMSLAYEQATVEIEHNCCHPIDPEQDGEYLETVYDTSSAEYDVTEEVAYLDSRRLLARPYPEHPEWVTICDESEPLPEAAPESEAARG